MDLLKIFFPKKLQDVFTPNTIAKLTYVHREILERDLEKYLSLPGKQIVIYGHSGSGKTTLLRNKLKSIKQRYIKTHCESTTTFNDLILQAFDALNKFYISEKSTNQSYSIRSELKTDYKLINNSIDSSQSKSLGEKRIRLVPPQLTPEKLACFLGEIDCVWIIEDFHKVEKIEKKRIADVVKIFIDCANDYKKVKIICIGAVGTARELIEFDSNLNNRVAELLVPLLADDEIKQIVNKGAKLLNLKVELDLIEKITYYSNNLASITHQICYDICFHKQIMKSKIFSQDLKSESFKVAVNSFVRKNSDTFSKLYDSIVCTSYGWNVLKAFERSEKEYLSFGEIKNGIPISKRPEENDIKIFLNELSSIKYNELLRYDRNSKKYSISSPFFRAFLKMKMAIEQSELKEQKQKRKNKRNKKYEIDTQNNIDFILNEEFFENYHQFLDSFIIKELKIQEKILKKYKK
ncbi:AAA family ATPase [Ornithobacterium rhinotracheale]